MTRFTKHIFWIVVLSLLLAVAVLPKPALAQSTVTIDLCATDGSMTLPDATVAPVWGFAAGNCSGSPTVSQPGGPLIVANVGETVQVTLFNRLAEPVALFFHGQPLPPDRAGAAPGGSVTYTFTAAEPGVFLYEAGPLTNALHQTAMGLHGALIVRPATVGQAYNSAATAYDVEAVLVLSELDPALNASASPATFNMSNFAPEYELINGAAFPDAAVINVGAGDRVLLRYVNAGALHHSMGVLGLNQRVIATDGNVRPNSYRVVAETVPPGATLDTLVTIPATAPEGARYAVHAGSLLLHNRSAGGYGGMMTFLTIPAVGPGSPDDVTGPAATNLALTPSGGDMIISATIDDSASGASNIIAAEYTLESTAGTPVAMSAIDSAFDAPIENVAGVIPAAMLQTMSAGNHSVYVRGQDAAGNWGAYNLIILTVDNAGPSTSALTLSPNPSQGNVNVALGGTASDVGRGASIIAAAEYFIDANLSTPPAPGTGAPMGLNMTASVSAITATLPSSVLTTLTEGVHTVAVRSQDASGQWGDFATIDLLIDRTGPATSGVTVAPNPNNGTTPINPSRPAIRVDATVSEPGGGPVTSTIQRVEGFIDLVGANGTGFPFTPVDGLFDNPTENAYAFIPLINLAQLAEGEHQISVRGQDSAGNWGPATTTPLTIDRTPPTVSGVTVTPNPTNSAPSVTLTGSANDALTAISAAEWFVGADPGAGNGAAMAITSGGGGATLSASVNVSTWLTGNYVLSVRARDAAGNWSAPVSVTLTVDDLIFADSFESGGVAAWSSATGAVNVINAAAMSNDGGTWGMAVTLAAGAPGYVTDATPNALTSYDARFYFHPNDSRAPTSGITIFAGFNAANNAVFTVQYRRPNPTSQPQIRAQVMRAGGTTNTAWVTLTNEPHAVEVLWRSGVSVPFALYVDGVQRAVANNQNTGAYTLEGVRMGPSSGLAGTLSGTQYFDAFLSKRSTTSIFGQ